MDRLTDIKQTLLSNSDGYFSIWNKAHFIWIPFLAFDLLEMVVLSLMIPVFEHTSSFWYTYDYSQCRFQKLLRLSSLIEQLTFYLLYRKDYQDKYEFWPSPSLSGNSAMLYSCPSASNHPSRKSRAWVAECLRFRSSHYTYNLYGD